ncbi:uncharacterized protein LOC133719983 [Rosa rugosa]|uniref:uncharacterized protein LOC133719983 n=1 Tax=Rosa rugosa TaxID=74645 RepID=UPI002B408E19|nr:uncharacterized protein LOC133719983 [Rosa rugosa]
MRPFDTEISGPFWILAFWLQIYFPLFRRGDIPKEPPVDSLLGNWLCRNVRYRAPPYSECFIYLYLLGEMPDPKIVLSRRFPPPLDDGFLPSGRDHSERAFLAFRRAISCLDIRLATERVSYELYAPNHFARQFGLAQLVPWPLVDSANYYTSWRRLAPPGSAHFQSQFTLIVIPPWVRALYPLNDVDDDYADWWKEVSVNCWDLPHDELFVLIFRGMSSPGPEDRKILERFSNLAAQPPRPILPSRSLRPGIQIHEPRATQTTWSRIASVQAGKQKAIAEETSEGESSHDEDPAEVI